jgi:hypothetical protein
MKRLLTFVASAIHPKKLARCINGRRIVVAVGLLAFASVCYLAGAAAMHFGLPSADFMAKAFIGAEVWYRGPADSQQASGEVGLAAVSVDSPKSTYDGFTLCSTTQGLEANLINMHGEVVYQWKMLRHRDWPKAANVRDPLPSEKAHFERCRVFPNGELLAMCCYGEDSPYGYGLVKLDKNSNVLWGYSADFHHDFDVGEDGRIYALTQKVEVVTPPDLRDFFPPQHTADYILVLAPDGQELANKSVLEMFCNTPYFFTLLPVNPVGQRPSPRALPQILGQPGSPSGPQPKAMPGWMDPRQAAQDLGDILHTNSVKVLSQTLAPKFKLFSAGQVLISLRTPSVIAMLDLDSSKVAWASRGIWQSQHDAQFLANGNILLFDNFGWSEGSRILEIDPVTQAVPWSYAGVGASSFMDYFRGSCQRLPNGNTLLVNSVRRRVAEISSGKEVVWQWNCPPPPAPDPRQHVGFTSFTDARRYHPAELPFLTAQRVPPR